LYSLWFITISNTSCIAKSVSIWPSLLVAA
jgi:hypothetical protein